MNDGDEIAFTLEFIARNEIDITPLVYGIFFDASPEYREVFKVVDPAQPPHGCGQMLFEILSLIQDQAIGKPYVANYMKDIASQHKSFGVGSSAMYKKFLQALTEAIRQIMGREWTPSHAAAWERQTTSLVPLFLAP